MEKSVLLEKPKDIKDIQYDETEKDYLRALSQRLTNAKDERDDVHQEFDGLSFYQYWQANETGANTYLKSLKNKQDTNFQSGTLRNKLMSLVSTIIGVNLKSEIGAYTDKSIYIQELGESLNDIVEKTDNLEGDNEWEEIRMYELVKQGTVFVEDIWREKKDVDKKLIKAFDGENAKWNTKNTTHFGPKRTIIPNTAVFLGDLTKYMIEDQPYIFTVQIMNYDEAKKIYGEWSRWKNVSREVSTFDGASEDLMASGQWRMMGTQEGKVEVVKYQDKPNNEFQILLNGVPMLPMGYPLTAISPDGEYTLVQQNLEPIRHNFAYGKSFIFRNKNIVAILDQMMKLAVLKTWKSFMPPRLNLTNRIISRDIFLPGKVTRGIQPSQLPPIDQNEAQGVTGSELSMIQEVREAIDKSTMSEFFQGQAPAAGTRTTATEIITLQRQARLMLGTVILSATLLKIKLTKKRLAIILKNWFEPIGKELNESRQLLLNRYRIVSKSINVDGRKGIKTIIPMSNMNITADEIYETESKLENSMGIPVRLSLLNVNQIKQANLVFEVNVNPREKKSSETAKVMFETMIQQAVSLGLQLNPDYVAKRFAEVWNEDASKMFASGGGMPNQNQNPPAPNPQNPQQNQPKQAGSTSVNLKPITIPSNV